VLTGRPGDEGGGDWTYRGALVTYTGKLLD
jgi:hypothetical protein